MTGHVSTIKWVAVDTYTGAWKKDSRDLTDHAKSIFRGQLCLCVQSGAQKLSGSLVKNALFNFLTFLLQKGELYRGFLVRKERVGK